MRGYHARYLEGVGGVNGGRPDREGDVGGGDSDALVASLAERLTDCNGKKKQDQNHEILEKTARMTEVPYSKLFPREEPPQVHAEGAKDVKIGWVRPEDAQELK